MNLSKRCGMIGTSLLSDAKSICLAPEDLDHKHDIFSMWSLPLPEYLVRHDLPADHKFELVDALPPLTGTCDARVWKHLPESHEGSLPHVYQEEGCVDFKVSSFVPVKS